MDCAFQIISLITWSAIFSTAGFQTENTCVSPQYMEIGTIGTIKCTFEQDFFSVLWYNTSDYVNNSPILRYGNSVKDGAGYESGEFDVHSNGSLIVKNVAIEHEGIFTAVYVRSRKEVPVVSEVRLIVVVKPDISFPHILNCGKNRTTCYSQVNSPIQCSVQDVRPNVTLKWIARTVDGDKIIPSDVMTTRGTLGYTFLVTTTDVFHYLPLLVLLVCEASSPTIVLAKTESMILVQNDGVDLSPTTAAQKYVELNTRLEIGCSDDSVGYIVWKKVPSPRDFESEDLLYSVLFGEQYTEVYVDDVTVNSSGSLVIPKVHVKHEGLYLCIFGDGVTDGWMAYDVQVTVNPVPAYLVIDGCSHQQYCVLEAESEGMLTCTVTGIRPQIQLQWKTFHDSDADLISFANQKLTVKDNGETFDVSLTSTYYVRDVSRDRLTIECREQESDYAFHFSTKVDLIFVDVFHPTDQPDSPATHNSLLWMFPVIAAVIVLLVVGGILTRKYIWKDNRHGSERQSADNEEIIAMLSRKVYDTSTIMDLKEKFLNQIKGKYKDWYDAVQPIPYIKDRLYCVDKVFVEGGIEFLESVEGVGQRGVWKSLKTYDNVFNAPQVNSSRRILEGEPGYGKSTITLQFAYDWCNQRPTSALKDVEILILLRLRQLGGVPSIYKAIKRFILPRDTTLSEEDIEYILRSCRSVVVILDGFDEYPDQDSTTITDVMTIIARQMFQDFEVVTTTRSSFLPKKYPPLTKRIRLTGFDDKARRYYIRKAVVGDDDEGVRAIEGYLEENPILSDLCQVPLLFVIFAHMTYESEQFRKLNSVTNFFRFMVSCFHSHMRNKMDDENVRKSISFEFDHRYLDKLAFEAFSGRSQRIVWEKEEMCQQVGHELYDQYIRIGILVEEEEVDIIDDLGVPICEHVQYKSEVRFYHKLFCEWYAAHYLVDYIQQNPDLDLSEFLRHLDPFDVQYLYRFACGLNPNSAGKIIDYLKNIEGGDKFAILCILEQTGKIDNIKETIRQLCFEGVIISGHDSLLLQRSSLQLLEIAARHDIPIRGVYLYNCLQSVDLSTSAIRTTSGLALTSRIPVKILEINLYNREMTEDEAIAILEFSSVCPSLGVLCFRGTVPPRSLEVDYTLAKLKSRNVRVKWSMFKDDPYYILNLETGRWQNEKYGKEPTREEFEKMRSEFAEQVGIRTEDDDRQDIKRIRGELRKDAEERRKDTTER